MAGRTSRAARLVAGSAVFPRMTLEDVQRIAGPQHLAVLGGVMEGAPDGIGTLLLLGPAEPGFWAHFTAQPEYLDGLPDPLDRWSERIIGGIAKSMNARAYFPFGGPPWHPFVSWALASGRAHLSPVGLLVHDRAGLMVSYRGAIGFEETLALPDAGPNPCDTCATQPCRSACPVDAFGADGYDVAACKTDLDQPENDCMSKGCAVRRACPLSRRHGRLEEQSAFHMRAFK